LPPKVSLGKRSNPFHSRGNWTGDSSVVIEQARRELRLSDLSRAGDAQRDGAAVGKILKDKHHCNHRRVNGASNNGHGKAKESPEVSNPPREHVWIIGGRELRF
jgi:hypothetical protein